MLLILVMHLEIALFESLLLFPILSLPAFIVIQIIVLTFFIFIAFLSEFRRLIISFVQERVTGAVRPIATEGRLRSIILFNALVIAD